MNRYILTIAGKFYRRGQNGETQWVMDRANATGMSYELCETLSPTLRPLIVQADNQRDVFPPFATRDSASVESTTTKSGHRTKSGN